LVSVPTLRVVACWQDSEGEEGVKISGNPSLYQINARAWLTDLSRRLGYAAGLDNVPDADLDRIAANGFELVYLLGVWRTGDAGRSVSRSNARWRQEFLAAVPDLSEDDICGSCFAVIGYDVSPRLGGDEALARFRTRLHQRGLKLILDFVPNHTAPDHPWVTEHPDYYVHGTDSDLARRRQNYLRTEDGTILAYGRDPYFDGWPDTLQLDYANPALQQAMLAELARVADRCDGVRCDMAMLVLPDVFQWTWERTPQSFWPGAVARIKGEHPGFLFMAEVYWGREWELQQQGFDYTYDKRLYDRLVEGDASKVREHLRADMDFQRRSARFLENHDEPRAAATFPPQKHRAAAAIAFLCPGLRFFHEGQLEGAKVRLPMHLCRRPVEPLDEELRAFYRSLLGCLRNPAVLEGDWQLLEPRPAWDGNWTNDCYVVQAWQTAHGDRVVTAVNFADHQSQCYVPLPFEGLAGKRWSLRDLLNDVDYEREGDMLATPGLYLDLPAWGYYVFRLV
jgi:hypothetical protein